MVGAVTLYSTGAYRNPVRTERADRRFALEFYVDFALEVVTFVKIVINRVLKGL